MSSLLATKLHRPAVPPKRVERPYLVQRLNDGLAFGRQVTLVSAPAGFGKTTCVSEWVATLACPVAWLSLDPADDDPARFVSYLLAALQKVDANLGREIEGALRAGQLPPAEAIHTALSNDILAAPPGTGRLVLVLDDLHVIQDPFILQLLQRLVSDPPPPLNLVLLTREDPPLPLARLRANNQLTEVRAADLRFSAPEAGRFLNEVLDLALSAADIALLEEKTEGWVAGLQLAGLSVRERADPAAFIADLSGSHRFILSYLTEEVLGRQPPQIQRFLLQTSVLDRLSGEVCDAVTGRRDSHALLGRLFSANLFLVPLDDQGRWYRYHHLFGGLLRELQKTQHAQETIALHRRASQWYAQADLPGEAMHHALAAGDYAAAVALLESHAMGMILRGTIKTVEGWIQAIAAEWRVRSPQANLACAWLHLLRGGTDEASPYLARLEAIFAGSGMDEAAPSLQAEWLALQSSALNRQGKPLESLERAGRALEIAPQGDHTVRSLIHLGRADAYQLLEDHARAAEAFQRMVDHGRAAENLILELLGLAGLAAMALRRGELQHAFEMASQGVERLERAGSLPPIGAALYGMLANVAYQRDQLQQAHHFYARATRVSSLSGYTDAQIMYAVVRARLKQLAGDLVGAGREMQDALDLSQRGAPASFRAEVIAQQVCLHLAGDDPAAAERALGNSGVSLRDAVSYKTDAIHSAYVRLLLYRGQEGRERTQQEQALRQARELVGRILASAEAGQRFGTTLHASILGARVHAAAGDIREGLAWLERALGWAAPEGFVRVFVDEGAPLAELLRRAEAQGLHADFAHALLAHFPAPEALRQGQEIGDLVESLTERELEILRLLEAGCSNQEIAARLVVTLNTVKKHNSNIYAKLGVNRRTQAVARARQLGLL